MSAPKTKHFTISREFLIPPEAVKEMSSSTSLAATKDWAVVIPISCKNANSFCLRRRFSISIKLVPPLPERSIYLTPISANSLIVIGVNPCPTPLTSKGNDELLTISRILSFHTNSVSPSGMTNSWETLRCSSIALASIICWATLKFE